jgi:Transposase, Mutator family
VTLAGSSPSGWWTRRGRPGWTWWAPDGLLADITRRVLETGLEVEMSDHLGYDKHAPEGRDGGKFRNGTRAKTVLTEVGPVEVAVPRDRQGTFEPATVRKRQRCLRGVDAMVISLCAKGLTTGEIQAHLAEVYSADISRETISKITDAVLEEVNGWLARPLDRVYPVVFIDAIHVKVRDELDDRAKVSAGRAADRGPLPSPVSSDRQICSRPLFERRAPTASCHASARSSSTSSTSLALVRERRTTTDVSCSGGWSVNPNRSSFRVLKASRYSRPALMTRRSPSLTSIRANTRPLTRNAGAPYQVPSTEPCNSSTMPRMASRSIDPTALQPRP